MGQFEELKGKLCHTVQARVDQINSKCNATPLNRQELFEAAVNDTDSSIFKLCSETYKAGMREYENLTSERQNLSECIIKKREEYFAEIEKFHKKIKRQFQFYTEIYKFEKEFSPMVSHAAELPEKAPLGAEFTILDDEVTPYYSDRPCLFLEKEMVIS